MLGKVQEKGGRSVRMKDDRQGREYVNVQEGYWIDLDKGRNNVNG